MRDVDPIRAPRDTMSLRPGAPVTMELPDVGELSKLCEQLARRAAAARDPLDIARLHHQRAALLADVIGDPDAAFTAHRASLDARPGYLPPLLALRERALAADDRALAEELADRHLPALAADPEVDPRDVAEVGGFFGLVWLFRWPDAARAAVALGHVEDAGDPLGLADRLLPICLDDDARVARDRRRLTGDDRRPHRLAELGRALVREGSTAAEGWTLIAEAAAADPVAAWYRVEQALATDSPATLARALEALARLCPGVGGPVLRFIAGELWELVERDAAQAARLYAEVDGGSLRAALAVKQIVGDARQFLQDPLGLAAALAEQADQIGDARLEAVLYLRAAQVAETAGDPDRARQNAELALERWPEDERARHLLERRLWQGTQWGSLRTLLTDDTRGELARLLRAALLEHALAQPAAALGALGGAGAPELLQLRTRQRLAAHMMSGETDAESEARVRAWQQEANLLQPSDRRADLYLRIARFYLARTPQLEKALTYLFWALDRVPDHLPALRIIERCCRSTGRTRPLVEALERLVPLIDRPAERAPLRRELAEHRQAAGAPPDELIELYRRALDDEPTDFDLFVHLEALYAATGRHADQHALYEESLRIAEGPEARARVAVRFGPFLVDRDDPIAALRLYDRVTPDTPPGPLRSRLEMLQTEAAAAGGLSGSLPALDPEALDALDLDAVDFDFADVDIDELLTVVSDPLAAVSAPPGPAPPPLPPLAPMAPTVSEGGRAAPVLTDAPAPAASSPAAPSPPAPSPLLRPPALRPPSLRPPSLRPPPTPSAPGHDPRLDLAAPAPDDDIEFEVDTDDTDLSGSVELMPADLLEDDAPAAPVHAPLADRASGFLGEERAGDSRRDPGRAVIARKLKRARGEATDAAFPDHGDADLADAAHAYADAQDVDPKIDAATALARRYEALGHPVDAIRAWRAVLGYRAGDPEAVGRLEALYRATEDWRGLVDILAGAATRTGDPARRQSLLLDVARLEWRALEDPGAAVGHFLEALDLGPVDRETIAELAEAVRAVRRWRAYVDALARGGLDDPADMPPDAAIELGRIHLYELHDAARAVPYLVRAARARPERVDIAADLAEARAALGEVDRAVELLERAIHAAGDLEPQARNVLRLRLARLLEEHADDPARARRVYRDALDEGLDDPAVLDRIDHLASAARDYDTLARVVERNLDDIRRRGGDADELRTPAMRLGHLRLKRLDQPREAAAAFIEAYALDPADDGLFRLIDGIVRKHPDPALQARLYTAWLSQPRPDADRLAISLRLVAAHEAQGRPDAAAAVLEDLHRQRPDDREVLGALERVYQAAGRWDELVAMYRTALDATDDPEARIPELRRLARAYEVGLRDLESATEIQRELLRLAPRDLTVLRALARLLEARKRWEDLLDVSARELDLVQNDRQRAFIWFRMGSLHESQLADPEAAAEAYRRALKLDPRCFPALHGLRELAARDDDHDAVIGYLRREFELWDEPREQAAVLARIGEIRAEHKADPAGARAAWREALDIWPTCLPAARALARQAYEAGDYETAAPCLQVLTNQKLDKLPRGRVSRLFYRRGVAARHLGRTLEAIESLKLALEFDGDNTEALHALVEVQAGEGIEGGPDGGLATLLARLDESYAAHEAAGRIDEMARIDILRGLTAEHRLDLAAAEAAFQRAIELCPDDPGTGRPLVDLHVKQRRWADATAALRALADRFENAARDPDADDHETAQTHRLDALFREAEIWSDMAVDPARAIACYATILELTPDPDGPSARLARQLTAQCHYLTGAFDDAGIIIEELLEIEDLPPAERAGLTFYMGRIEQIGFHDDRRARERYRAALAADPHCASALLALAVLLRDEGDPDAVVELLREHQALVEAPSDDPEAAALKTFAASVWHRHGQSDAALRLLAPLADGSGPAARDARFALAHVHEARDRIDDAATQLYRSLDLDICDVPALRALAELRARQGDDERQFHALSALDLYGALTPDERTRYTALRDRNRKQRDRGGRTVADAALEADLAHPSYHSPLVPLLSLCGEALAPGHRPRPTLRRAEQVNGRRHTFTLELRQIETLLGRPELDLYFIGDHPELVSLWPGKPPLVVLGAPALGERCTTAERRFLVGRAAFYARAGLAQLHDLGPERSLDLLARVGDLVAHRDRPTQPLLDALPDRDAETIRGWLVRLGPTTTLPAIYTGESVLAGITSTADRAGLLTGGHLRAAVEMLTRHVGVGETIEHGDDLAWAVRSGGRLRDLVRYALSDAYQRLRRATGLAI